MLAALLVGTLVIPCVAAQDEDDLPFQLPAFSLAPLSKNGFPIEDLQPEFEEGALDFSVAFDCRSFPNETVRIAVRVAEAPTWAQVRAFTSLHSEKTPEEVLCLSDRGPVDLGGSSRVTLTREAPAFVPTPIRFEVEIAGANETIVLTDEATIQAGYWGTLAIDPANVTLEVPREGSATFVATIRNSGNGPTSVLIESEGRSWLRVEHPSVVELGTNAGAPNATERIAIAFELTDPGEALLEVSVLVMIQPRYLHDVRLLGDEEAIVVTLRTPAKLLSASVALPLAALASALALGRARSRT